MKKISLYLLIVLLISACDEVFEKDITNAKLEIIAPCDNLVTTKTTLVFWWNELKDANSYKLQIVSTSFDTILSIPVDSNLTTNKFEATLNPGKYGWRVKAVNSATETEWFTQNFTIRDTADLSIQEVLLNSPKEGNAFNKGKTLFKWTKLPRATSYMLIVKENSWSNPTPVVNEVTTHDTLTATLDGDKKYVWGVIGINEGSQSKPKNNTFYVDITAPDVPTLQLPKKDSIITGTTATLHWIHQTDHLTSIYDSLYAAKDKTFTQASIIASIKEETATSYILNSNYKGIIYWRVKSIDKAGNKSAFSDIFNFTLQ